MSSTIILSSIRCAACGKAGDNLKTCISCKQVKYCNRECQILHWPKHKKLCKQHAAELARNDNKSDSNTKTNTEGIGSINISDTDIAADKKKSTTYDDEQNQLLMDAGLSDLIDIDKVDLSGLINCLTENMRENIVKMDLSDDELFQDPPPRKECPICMEPVPFHSGVCNVNYSYQACCGKVLCCGCMAVTAEEMVKGNLKELCAYCRLPIRCSNQEYMKRVKRRMKLNEAKAYLY